MRHQGCLPFTPKNQKFRVENQMVQTIPFGTFRKKWAVVWGNPLLPDGERTIWQYPFGFEFFVCGQNKMAAKDTSDGRWKLHGLFICFCEWVFLRCKLHFPGLSKSIGLEICKINVPTADCRLGNVDGQFTRPSSFHRVRTVKHNHTSMDCSQRQTKLSLISC